MVSRVAREEATLKDVKDIMALPAPLTPTYNYLSTFYTLDALIFALLYLLSILRHYINYLLLVPHLIPGISISPTPPYSSYLKERHRHKPDKEAKMTRRGRRHISQLKQTRQSSNPTPRNNLGPTRPSTPQPHIFNHRRHIYDGKII